MGKIEIKKEIVKAMDALPTLPGIAIKILDAVKEEESGLKELGKILSADPPLSLKVLKIINSTFYGLPTKVTSVPHAVNLLGINTVRNLALCFSLIRHFNNNNGQFDYTLFWKISLTNAIISKLMAQKIIPDLAEDAFFLGLLHDIGILGLNQCMPKEYGLVLKEKNRTLCLYHEAENNILGFNHMEIGGYLAETWGLPEAFYTPIRYHHAPKTLRTESPEIDTITKILHLSSSLADFINLPYKMLFLGMFEWYAKEYGFSDHIQVDETVKQVHEHTKDVFPLFEMKMETEESYLDMLEKARSQLSDFPGENPAICPSKYVEEKINFH